MWHSNTDLGGTELATYSAAIFRGDINNIIVIDANKRIANYWSSKFLKLSQLRNSEINTKSLLKLIDNEKMFSDDLDQELKTRIKNYLKINLSTMEIFSVNELFKKIKDEFLNEKDERSINQIFKEDSFGEIDALFQVDKKSVKNKYSRVVTPHEDISVSINDFSRWINAKIIKIVDDKLQIDISDDLKQDIMKAFGVRQ